MLALFALTIFVSSALLFLVQPMFARLVLPLLGGSPSVWNTAMVFYQGALLGGYACSHITLRWLGPRRQPWFQLLLLLGAAATPPLGVPAAWIPATDSSPIPGLLRMMAVSV